MKKNIASLAAATVVLLAATGCVIAVEDRQTEVRTERAPAPGGD